MSVGDHAALWKRLDSSAQTVEPERATGEARLRRGLVEALVIEVTVHAKSLRLFAEKVLPAVQAMPTPINPASLGQPRS